MQVSSLKASIQRPDPSDLFGPNSRYYYENQYNYQRVQKPVQKPGATTISSTTATSGLDLAEENKSIASAIDQIKEAFLQATQKAKTVTSQKDTQIDSLIKQVNQLQQENANLKSQLGADNSQRRNSLSSVMSSSAIPRISDDDAFKDKKIKELQKALDESHAFTRELSQELFHLHKKLKEVGISQPTREEKRQVLSTEDQKNYDKMIANLQEQIKAGKRELMFSNEKLTKQIAKEEQEVTQYQHEIQNLKAENQRLQSMLNATSSGEISTYDTEELARLREENAILHKDYLELKRTKEEYAKLQKDNLVLINRIKELQKELERPSEAQNVEHTANPVPNDAENQIAQLNKRIEILQNRLALSDQRATTYQDQLCQQKRKFENNAQFLVDARSENIKLRNENVVLKAENAKLKEQLSTNDQETGENEDPTKK